MSTVNEYLITKKWWNLVGPCAYLFKMTFFFTCISFSFYFILETKRDKATRYFIWVFCFTGFTTQILKAFKYPFEFPEILYQNLKLEKFTHCIIRQRLCTINPTLQHKLHMERRLRAIRDTENINSPLATILKIFETTDKSIQCINDIQCEVSNWRCLEWSKLMKHSMVKLSLSCPF